MNDSHTDVDPMDVMGGWDLGDDDRQGGGGGERGKFPVRPPVWVHAKVLEATTGTSKKFQCPQIQLKAEIIKSQADPDGEVAKGKIVGWISAPSPATQGHPVSIKIERRIFNNALASLLAPEVYGDEAQAKAKVLSYGRSVEDYAKLLPGREVLVRLGIDNGKNKDGSIRYQPLVDNPKNTFENFMPVGEKYMKYLEGTGPKALKDYLPGAEGVAVSEEEL